MIDGLIKLKTLVIDEEGKNKSYYPKIIKQSKDERPRIYRVNHQKQYKTPGTDLASQEISRILETENENDTPKDIHNISKHMIRLNKQGSISTKNPQSNSFKTALKK